MKPVGTTVMMVGRIEGGFSGAGSWPWRLPDPPSSPMILRHCREDTQRGGREGLVGNLCLWIESERSGAEPFGTACMKCPVDRTFHQLITGMPGRLFDPEYQGDWGVGV